MNTLACYCQKCRSANSPGDDTCAKCGTPLMIVVVPPSVKHENVWDDYSEEHLLERISHLELRLMQVTDRLSKVLDLMLKQSQTLQREHLLVETLVEALETAKIIENGKVSEIWKERQNAEAKKHVASERRERALDETLIESGGANKLDLFTNLVKDGFRQIERGEETSGLRTLERAAKMSAENLPLLSYIGEHYFRADKRREAREYLEKAVLLEPKNARINVLLGFILTDEGEFEAAKKALALARETYVFAAEFLLGVVYAVENDLDEALAAFKLAQAVDSCAEICFLCGSTFAEIGKNRNALKHLQKAVELDANFADAWFMLGAIHLRLEDETAARDSFTRALSAKDAGAQCLALLKNPKRNVEAAINLFFARLASTRKNPISGLSPRLYKVLREEIEKILSGN